MQNQLIDIIITQRAKVTDMEVLQKKLEDMHAEVAPVPYHHGG